MSAPARALTVRHVQLLRAAFAAVAALMITFSPDHSAAVGLAVFGGFAATSALILALGAWLAVPAGARWPYVLLAVLGMLAAMASGVPAWRTDALFFVIVIAWAAASGLVELIAGLRSRRSDPSGKDAIAVGVLGLLLAVLVLLVPADYMLGYSIEGAGEFTLTGIILAVGLFGGYAAIVAVYLAIAGFSPRRPASDDASSGNATQDDTSANGGTGTSPVTAKSGEAS